MRSPGDWTAKIVDALHLDERCRRAGRAIQGKQHQAQLKAPKAIATDRPRH